MIEHHESQPNLMEELYESSVPELVDMNLQAQKEAGQMITSGRYDTPVYIDLQLVPEFMTNKAGILMVNPKHQRKVAEQTLNGLHKSWDGTKSIENEISETITENYWEFVDVDNDFTPWTVVELHNSSPMLHEVALSAYMIPGTRRPKAYQDLLNQKELDHLKKEDDSADAVQPEVDTVEVVSRKRRAVKTIGKWLKSQTNLPPRPNRFE